MKKTLRLIFMLFILNNAYLSGQTLRIIYDRHLSFNESIKKILPMEKVIEIEKSAKNTVSYYSLLICDNYSFWQFDSIKWGCSIQLKENDRPIDYLQFDTSNEKYMKFHFDKKEQYYHYVKKNQPSGLRWDIDFNKTRNILGYKCYRAIGKGNKRIEAWFTPEIPTVYGPADVNNLPGLVLRYTTSTAEYTIRSISSISPAECPNIHIQDVKTIHSKERNDLWRNYDFSIKAQDFRCH